MKITLMQAKQSEGVLSKIVNQDVLAIHIAYRISKLARAMAVDLATLEEQRVVLVKKIGDENEKGNIEVAPDQMEDFLSQYNELLKEEIELPFKKVKLSDLSTLTLSPNDLVALEPFFIAPDDDFEEAEVVEAAEVTEDTEDTEG